MSDLTSLEYGAWLSDLKQRIQSALQRANLSVNRKLMVLFWQIGRDSLNGAMSTVEEIERDLQQWQQLQQQPGANE